MKDDQIFERVYFRNSSYFQIVLYPHNDSFLYYENIFELMEQLKKEKIIENWYFVNKNKKILLKVKLDPNHLDDIKPFILKIKNDAFRVEFDTFEPEIYQFGGETGWSFALIYLNAFSKIILKNRNDLLTQKNVAILALSDLIIRSSGDAWEAWDIVQRLKNIRNFKVNENDQLERQVELLITNPKKNYKKIINDAYTVSKIIKTNTDLVNSIEQNKFDLLFQIRKIIPFYVIFILNIANISLSAQIRIIATLALLLNPEKY